VASIVEPDALAQVEIFACGPTAMLEAHSEGGAGAWGGRVRFRWKSLWLVLWVGARGALVAVQTADGPAMKRVCVDGPVFDGMGCLGASAHDTSPVFDSA